jgi:hypothetical protein
MTGVFHLNCEYKLVALAYCRQPVFGEDTSEIARSSVMTSRKAGPTGGQKRTHVRYAQGMTSKQSVKHNIV